MNTVEAESCTIRSRSKVPAVYIAHSAPSWNFPDLARALADCITGNPVERLRERIAGMMGNPHVLVTNLGRTALVLGLRALGLEKGAGVILPAIVCGTVIRAVMRADLRPIIVDVSDNLLMTPETVSAESLSGAKAIIVPHLYGLTAPIQQFVEWASSCDLIVIDDAAQAAGMSLNGRCLGTFGRFGILSFGPFKSINCPRGGALLSSDRQITEMMKNCSLQPETYNGALQRILSGTIKFHARPTYLRVAGKFRSTANREKTGTPIPRPQIQDPLASINPLEAALSDICLSRVQSAIQERRSSSKRLWESIRAVNTVEFAGASDAPYLKIPVRLPRALDAAAVVAQLRSMRIEAERIYRPLHSYSPYKQYACQTLHRSEECWDRVVLIPNRTSLSDEGLYRLTRAFADLQQS